jgi:hypothetical protein
VYSKGMTTQTSKTAGQTLTAELMKNFGAGTRTRRYGKVFGRRVDLHKEMIEAITNAVQLPGFYGPERTEVYRLAWGAALSYGKHVEGCRIDGMLAKHINSLSAYQFAKLLGQMVDAGVGNVGEGERFFAEMASLAR